MIPLERGGLNPINFGQTGSHVRISTQRNGEHHVTIPAYDPIKVGTLNAILRDIADHADLSREELLEELFS